MQSLTHVLDSQSSCPSLSYLSGLGFRVPPPPKQQHLQTLDTQHQQSTRIHSLARCADIRYLASPSPHAIININNVKPKIPPQAYELNTNPAPKLSKPSTKTLKPLNNPPPT